MTPAYRLRIEIAVATLFGLGLVTVAFRAGRVLTFDGYYYVEFAKKFSAEWPDRFGNHWPYGWPLAGGLLARCGLSGFWALMVLSAVSLTTLVAAAGVALAGHSARAAVLFAIAAAPIVAPQVGGVLTELPFATALLLLAICLGLPSTAATWWTAAGCAVLALTIRYAGLVALPVIGVAVLARWVELRAARQLGLALCAFSSACLVSGGLLLINFLRIGSVSGADRGSPPGLGALGWQLIDFGWSAPSALIAGGLRDRVQPDSPLGLVIGAVCFIFLATLCAWSWLRPRSSFSRPLALVTLGYATGMGVLRCVGEFDALHNARTFMPILAPGIVLVAERLIHSRRITLAVCAGLVALGAVAAYRGISRQIAGDVAAAVPLLRARIHPSDQIAINHDARTVAAHFANRTVIAVPSPDDFAAPIRYLVASGRPLQRNGGGALLDPAWSAELDLRVASGRWRPLLRTPHLAVLERVPSSPQ